MRTNCLDYINRIYKQLLLALTCLSMLAGCVQLEDEELKIPVEVQYYLAVAAPSQAGGYMTFSGGSLLLETFEFDGRREQADPVYFEKEYSQGLAIPFSASQPIASFNFQLPQGTYSRIEVELELLESEKSLEVYGKYENLDGEEIPFHFQRNGDFTFEMAGSSDKDGQYIVIKQEDQPEARMLLQPEAWFSSVPRQMLEDADLTSVNGIATLMISEEQNEAIFDLLEDAMESAQNLQFIY